MIVSGDGISQAAHTNCVSGPCTRFPFRHPRIRVEVQCKPGPDRSVTHAREEAERNDPFYFIFPDYVRARLRLEVKVKATRLVPPFPASSIACLINDSFLPGPDGTKYPPSLNPPSPRNRPTLVLTYSALLFCKCYERHACACALTSLLASRLRSGPFYASCPFWWDSLWLSDARHASPATSR